MADATHNLPKDERLYGKHDIDRLFAKESRSMTAFPLRAVYTTCDGSAEMPPVRIMVSAPKKYLRHAVDRNRVKRQVREAYRLNRNISFGAARRGDAQSLMIGFIWLDTKLWRSDMVEKRVRNLMQRISEKIYG